MSDTINSEAVVATEEKTKTPTNAVKMAKTLDKIMEELPAMTKMLTRVMDTQDKIVARVADLEAKANGKDAEFEKSLKKVEGAKQDLTSAEREWFGDEAPLGLKRISNKILGADFIVYAKPNDVLPNTLVTVLCPERLSGKAKDFRSFTVKNISVEQDARKWFEKVKTAIHRDFLSKQKGAPMFLIE
jgi:BMFP domain-containing protein YqiC